MSHKAFLLLQTASRTGQIDPMHFSVVRVFKRKKRYKYQVPGAHFELLICRVSVSAAYHLLGENTVLFRKYLDAKCL